MPASVQHMGIQGGACACDLPWRPTLFSFWRSLRFSTAASPAVTSLSLILRDLQPQKPPSDTLDKNSHTLTDTLLQDAAALGVAGADVHATSSSLSLGF